MVLLRFMTVKSLHLMKRFSSFLASSILEKVGTLFGTLMSRSFTACAASPDIFDLKICILYCSSKSAVSMHELNSCNQSSNRPDCVFPLSYVGMPHNNVIARLCMLCCSRNKLKPRVSARSERPVPVWGSRLS